MRTSSGCRPCTPRSMQVRLPVSTISSSTCFFTLATTSSMRAGWMRPSATSWWRARRQISRRTGSKALMTIASGVSSTTISVPVAASNARMLRPSRPITRPLTSSDSIWKTLTEFSTAVSLATRWIDWMMIFFASLLAVILASSMISLMYCCAWVLASSFSDSIKDSLASSVVKPEIVSNFERWSVIRASSFSCCFDRLIRCDSTSFCFF